MKIAAVFNPDSSNALYRSRVPMAALERRGHDVAAFPQTQSGEPSISLDELAEFDVVHVHRIIVNEDDDYVDRLHAAGVFVCFDNDDDARAVTTDMWEQLMADVDRASVDHILSEYERTLALLPRMDLVTTPSTVLAERFEAAGARDVLVLDNYLPPDLLRIEPVGREGLIVGWHGRVEHVWDQTALGIDRVLADLLEAHPHVHVVTIGVRLELESSRYTHVPEGVPLSELLNHLSDFDIGIAPLADNPFSQARSAVKLREYAAAGVPWLASPVGPYLGMGKAEGGGLVDDDGWFTALDRLVRSPVERALLRRRARAWTRRELIDRTVWQWEDAFEQALV